jgi:Spy/CpxP family protein refolding chaperone
MNKSFLIALGLVLVMSTSAVARPPQGPGGGLGGPARGAKVAPLFARSLILPDTIMRHQARLELTDTQRAMVQKVLRKTRRTIEDTRWELAAQTETIRKLLTATPINQIQAMEETGKLFHLETTIKTRHLKMLIRITNVLTPEQLKKARRIQKKSIRGRGKSAWRPLDARQTPDPASDLSD